MALRAESKNVSMMFEGIVGAREIHHLDGSGGNGGNQWSHDGGATVISAAQFLRGHELYCVFLMARCNLENFIKKRLNDIRLVQST